MTQLNIAAKNNDVGLVGYLLHSGANVNMRDKATNTALTYAVAHKNSAMEDSIETVLIKQELDSGVSHANKINLKTIAQDSIPVQVKELEAPGSSLPKTDDQVISPAADVKGTQGTLGIIKGDVSDKTSVTSEKLYGVEIKITHEPAQTMEEVQLNSSPNLSQPVVKEDAIAESVETESMLPPAAESSGIEPEITPDIESVEPALYTPDDIVTPMPSGKANTVGDFINQMFQ